MPKKKIGAWPNSAHHPLYRTWTNMKRRCSDSKAKNFDIYGGRGISVCNRWLIFKNFADDMGPKPSPKHTLDRINSNGNYEASNCRWADSLTQGRNTSRVKLIEYKGESKCLPHWAATLGIKKATLKSRIKAGWSIEKSFSKKPNYSQRS